MDHRLNGALNLEEETPMEDREYSFDWSLLGDIELGRPNLGRNTRLEIYRLMQFTIRDVLEKHLGSQETDNIFYEAERLAGKHFYQHFLTRAENLDAFLSLLQVTLQELGVGILRIEKADLDQGILILTVSEDLDCSGLPEGEHLMTFANLTASAIEKARLIEKLTELATIDPLTGTANRGEFFFRGENELKRAIRYE
jgi:uncharacterized protein